MTPRRHLLQGLALGATLWTAMPWRAALAAPDATEFARRMAEIEARSGGRLGVALLDTGSGFRAGHRAAERFPMASTFKLLLAGAVLRRVDEGKERLDRVIRFTRDDLVPYAPVTGPAAGGPGLTVAALCEATVTLSDNPAANLLLDTVGGPAGLTAFLRGLGDATTRLDRTEPALNEGRPGDPRDTTTPDSMAFLIRALALGDALRPASRERLMGWLLGNRTGDAQIRAGLPQGWRAAEKTGSNPSAGIANDVGLLLPPGRAPVLLAAYLTEARIAAAERPALLAEVARAAVRALG
ncbi:class A beta-lactamase [Pseudoroseomonas cervicalis]|uniref:Beta-lactamase n=1 Tax=Pseudoroseomonas cervicalis ATCC 49957 TaxID=525371 RepID=D5RSM8_9PROT|nr:class A beta-lactamase [Pseudoroseomonas cervicalis]EFH09690.1 beta-lactamase [Pseudoroseomonas cervicalis ATCC 49957]